ncbi:unnamed protein product [Schistosoma curassoni]|uniref:DUF294_C domain-containing protein n=1 Tax=Schistosoma curassoni TaxID=6186 RepID=A0A183JQ18_9TREM|nr:unnamed protein product [Schistosoma curassoni]
MLKEEGEAFIGCKSDGSQIIKTSFKSMNKKILMNIIRGLDGPAPLNPQDMKIAQTYLTIDDTLPPIVENSNIIRQISSSKATEPDIKLAESLKSDIELDVKMLHVLFRKILEKEQVPTD